MNNNRRIDQLIPQVEALLARHNLAYQELISTIRELGLGVLPNGEQRRLDEVPFDELRGFVREALDQLKKAQRK